MTAIATKSTRATPAPKEMMPTDASTQGDAAGDEGQQDDDEARQAGPRANGGAGTKRRTQVDAEPTLVASQAIAPAGN